MLGASFIALAAALALSMPADGRKEWKRGASFYDLQLHSIPADESAVAGDICSSAFVALVNFMQDEGGDQASIGPLRAFSFAWKEEGVNRREIDLETHNDTYLVPAFGLMRQPEIEDHGFWTECAAG